MLEMLQCNVNDFQEKLSKLNFLKLQTLVNSVDQFEVSRVKCVATNFELLYEKCTSLGISIPFWLESNTCSSSFVVNR